ncbi:MAG: transketolase family protein [Clostridia bacterium]|nr:transketolase family protein [Clostridia bacterium]
MAEKLSTRAGYGKALVELAEKYDYYVLDADLAEATKTVDFSKKYPNRFFDIGIAEADMVGTAVGLSSCGATVFASTFAMFAAGRAFEQVRNGVCYNNLNVKIVGTHGGILIGEDGGSHQAIEDVSLMRTIPNMKVIVPADAIEAKYAVEAAINEPGPVYLRFGRYDVPVFNTDENYSFTFGKANVLKVGTDVTVIAMGDMVYEALCASEELAKEGISVGVINMHTIKPIDKDAIQTAMETSKHIMTAEDHNVFGGLYSAVSEVVAEFGGKISDKVAVEDRFGQSGNRADLQKEYGLTCENIVAKIRNLMKS